ncbi:MAG: PKD domain-containing protein [Flavobacteriaceae bacterium]
MKTINNLSLKNIMALILGVFTLVSCEFELPESGSIEDETPPSAMFIAEQSEVDFLIFNFGNLSDNATDYAWDFGDGMTSEEVEPSHQFTAVGNYTVSLTASDKLGASSQFTMDVLVEEPPAPPVKLPEILAPGFEPVDGVDGKEFWRNNDLGGITQITSSPVYQGEKAAKLPSGGDRILYQELEVSPNADYVLTYYYTMKESGEGSVTISVLNGGGFTDIADVEGATIEKFVGTNQEDSDEYVRVDLYFNSGANTVISIFGSNVGVESRLDSFSLSIPE